MASKPAHARARSIQEEKSLTAVNESSDPVFEVMVTHVEAEAVELFATYEVPATPAALHSAPGLQGLTEAATLAVIGFVGKGVRGSLVMLALEAAVSKWLAAMGDDSGDPVDALGEFANMLLGRLKNRLLLEGLVLQVSTPTTAAGNQLRISAPSGRSQWLLLEGGDWDVQIRLDADFDADFALQEQSARQAPAEAGEAIFF
jgi:CheY-specific phosphatase CheX